MTIQEALQKGLQVLGKDQILEIEVLLSYVLEKDREYLFGHKEQEVNDNEFNKFKTLIKRHHNGEPIAYLTYEKEFFGMKLYVDKRVLIPRPETEMLVEKIIEFVKNSKKYKKELSIIDVGTGSGNIAVALAKQFSHADITATDISLKALEVARKNIKKYGFEKKIRLIKSNLLEKVKDKKFDMIVANLPYIGIEKNNFVSRETLEFEPHKALFGGNDGLFLYEKLFEFIKKYENCNVYLLGEIGFMHREKMEELIKEYFFGLKFEIIQDLAGLDRYFIVHFKS